MKKTGLLFLIFGICINSFPQKPGSNVRISEQGNIVTLANGLVEFSFNKETADLTAIKKGNDVNLLGKKGRGYLMGPGFSMLPSTYRLVRQTPGLIEIAFYHQADNSFQYDLHYVLKEGESGVYCYLVQTHKAGDKPGNYGQTRWGLRADESLFDYHLVRDSIQGPMPKMAELTDQIQDWTYRMADGTVYTKYDFADYVEGRNVFGYAGTKSGLGIFVILPSHEFINGGPTKQQNTVHANPFLISMFNCGHFLSDQRKSDGRINNDWQKLDGPFFLYVNSGKTIAGIWADAKQKAALEIKQWPYAWMKNPLYPLDRGTVSGTLFLTNKQNASGAHVILASGETDWQAQSRGYIFSTVANNKGDFTITHVRPGTYTLYAYADNVCEEYRKDSIHVTANGTLSLGKLDWTPATHGNTLWQIGTADRTTRGFRLSDHKRNYGVFNEVPADLTYTIGESHENADWYYAQTKPGTWTVNFDAGNKPTGECTLTIAIAGAAKNPLLEIRVNNRKISEYLLGNDASIYRSAILSGYYQQRQVTFPAEYLQPGKNTVSFTLPNVKPGGGVMYDAIKLEIKSQK